MSSLSKYPMTPMNEALDRLRVAIAAVGDSSLDDVVEIASSDAAGRVLAVKVTALHNVPTKPCSRLDGYAVVHSYIRDRLGQPQKLAIHAARPGVGNCVAAVALDYDTTYVTTGGTLPAGADTVIKVEDALRGADGETVTFNVLASLGEGVRPVGSDVRENQVLFDVAHELSAADVGGLLLARVPLVYVAGCPRIALVSTGDEVARAENDNNNSAGGEPVWDANAPMLRSFITAWGGKVISQSTVADDYEATRLTLARAATSGAHIVVVTGGVSMGDRDFVKSVLEELSEGWHGREGEGEGESEARATVSVSGKVLFGRLLMKPGKPATLATLSWTRSGGREGAAGVSSGICLVLALPGNPVSALVCALVLLRPALRSLLGIPWERASFPEAIVSLDGTLPLDPERPEYHRATVWAAGGVGGLVARSTGAQASSRLASAAHANALLWIPQARMSSAGSSVAGGTLLRALIFGPLAMAPPPVEASVDVGVGAILGSCGCSPSSSAAAVIFASAPALPSLTPAAARALHDFTPPLRGVNIGILTVSDSAAHGKAIDESGPAAAALLSSALTLAAPLQLATVADDASAIILQLQRWSAPRADGLTGPVCDLIITTGGTGFGVRDVTPEATAAVLTKRAPGFVAVMLAAGLAVTPRAALSRPEAGVREGCGKGGPGTLIINLPGAPKAVKESLTPLLGLLPHALSLIKGD